MTQSDRQQWHDLLDALADGELQVNLRTKESPLWTSASYLNTEVGPHMFRRKPKPRDLYLVYIATPSDKSAMCFDDASKAAEWVDRSNFRHEVIRVREVLD